MVFKEFNVILYRYSNYENCYNVIDKSCGLNYYKG